MKYVLQVVRGRSTSTTLKLADGVTSIGRHDDCLIRIKSSQVSRRHCELFEASNKLTVRDMGSSNGTYVNGKKVLGQQVLKAGDELTLGGITLRVAKIGQAPPPVVEQASSGSKPKAADTAIVAAIPASANAESASDEFELDFDNSDAIPEIEGIPLIEEPPKSPKPVHAAAAPVAASVPTVDQSATTSSSGPKEDDAVAQFLLDLKLDDVD